MSRCRRHSDDLGYEEAVVPCKNTWWSFSNNQASSEIVPNKSNSLCNLAIVIIGKWCTNSLSPWSRIHLKESLSCSRMLVAFYGTQMFILFSRSRHCTSSLTIWIQSSLTPRFVKPVSILCLNSLSGFFPTKIEGSVTKISIFHFHEWGRRGMHIGYWWESQKERDH
jgi:hypothetical protein